MKKDLELWYSRLETRGKVIAALAAVGVIWLVVQLVLAIAGVSLGLGIFGIILNFIAIALIALISTQFYIMRKMQRDYETNMREMMMKGRRGGAKHEQIAGRRTQASMRRGGGGGNVNMGQAISVSTENLDKHFRPKPLAKPSIIADWKEISDAGLYALEEAPKDKIEILDASDIGGGFFVGKYSGKYVQERALVTHRQSGEPMRFSTLRNAKQALSGKVSSGGGGNRKKKPKRKNSKKRA